MTDSLSKREENALDGLEKARVPREIQKRNAISFAFFSLSRNHPLCSTSGDIDIAAVITANFLLPPVVFRVSPAAP